MEFNTTAILLTLIAIVAVRWLIWRYQQISIFEKLGVSGPRPNLFFGNYLELYAKGPIKCHKEWTEKYGRVMGYYQGMTPILLVADPQMLKDIFVKDFSKFVNRPTYNALHTFDPKNEEDSSVSRLEGQKWKEVRSVITPSYTPAKLKQMEASMSSSIDEMLDILKTEAGRGKDLDMYNVYRRLAMDVITRTAFGVRTGVQKTKESMLVKSAEAYLGVPYRDPLTVIGLSFPLLRPVCLKLQKVMLGIHDFGMWPFLKLRNRLSEVLECRRNQLQSSKQDLLQLMVDAKVSVDEGEEDIRKLEARNTEKKSGTIKDDSAVKMTRNLTDKEIIANSEVVLVASYGTTSKTLAFTTYLLAKHQDIQERLFQEINNLILSGQSLEYATVNKIPYLDQVLNESLRIYPITNLFTNRYATEDVVYGNLKIPKGMMVQAPVYLLHHDPEFWTDPEVFDPDRFSTQPNKGGITYMPFGVGPRSCLGMRFGQMEMKLALSHILLNLHLRLSKTQKDKMELACHQRSIGPANGVVVNMKLRNR